MTREIDDLREHLRAYLEGHPDIKPVEPKSGKSDKVHLSVYRATVGKPVGIEFDKDTLQNIWLRASDAAGPKLANVKETPKQWNGVEWKSADGKGANSNLSAYDDFLGHDLVRFGVKSKDDADAILGRVFAERSKHHYFLKVNGELHCPNGICRPDKAEEWEGGEVLVPMTGPVRVETGQFAEAPPIAPGDELWIWTHEDDQFGRGWGMTATAKAGAVRDAGDFLAITINNVERIPRPFGYRDLGGGETGSSLLDQVRRTRAHRAYLIEDDAYAELVKIIAARSTKLPDDVRLSYAEGWEREVLNHKEDLIAGLQDRKTTTQKARPGQAQFRAELMKRYNGKCVVTRFALPEVLEAAHVMPHTGDPKWDHPDNGLLLRRDLHSLFDAMLWSIDPKSNRVRLADRLKATSYGKLDGRQIAHQVAPALLEVHFRQFKKGEAN